MKKTIVVLMVFVAAMSFSSCNKEQKGSNAEELIAAANALDDSFVEAYNQGDAEKMMATYWNSPDLHTCMPAGSMMTHGFEETKNVFMEDFKNNPGAKLEIYEKSNTVHGDVVVGTGLFTWTLAKEGEEAIVSKGRYTDVKVMKDGKMVYVADHASVPMMMPEEMEKMK